MNNFYWTFNLGIHLIGSGPFRTSIDHNWAVRPGWVISGDGIDVTTVQLTGSVAGISHSVELMRSDSNISTNNVTISDLTIDCNWTELSTTADIGTNGEMNIKTGAVALYGSNNLISRVRSINTYGSWPNKQEQFAIMLVGPRDGDGTGNVIQFCRAESPRGTYGSPFALHGWTNSVPSHLITNSRVVSSFAVGINDGKADGFTSGGVNLANVKDCQVDGNTFTDCFGAAYIDTGSCDGLHITNNTVTRGWQGVGIVSWAQPKQNIEISGNTFGIQNRIVGGASYGIVVGYGATTNLTIDRNVITFDLSGGGLMQYWGIGASLLTNAAVTNNTVGFAYFVVSNSATGTGITLFSNHQADGTPAPGL